MQKLITIVIPTYNMQDYLQRCLDSLIVPDEQMAQLEVLVINDGSKDNSSAIAHECENKYPNTFRVIDKENGNYGSCVNRGLKEAKGKYIKILDADDWFDTSEFSHYLSALQNIETDLVLTSFSIVKAEAMQATLAYRSSLSIGKKYDASKCTIDKIGIYTMHAITYRTQLLLDINYHQTEGISYTDSEWTHLPLYAVQSITYLNYNVYQYLVGREGQTMNPKVMLRTINHHEIIARSLIENEHNHPSEGFAHITIERQIEYLLTMVYKMRLIEQESTAFDSAVMKEFDDYLRQTRPDIHKKMGTLHLKTYAPIPYVWYWRTFGHRFPIDSIRNLYRRIRYGKRS